MRHEDYIESKNLKKGLITLKSPLLDLQNWFMDEYGVKPLNLIYEFLEHNQKPRLTLVWDTREDTLKFNPDWREFKNKEEIIVKKFQELSEPYKDYSAERMFMINGGFSYLAITEANQKVKEEEIENLIKELSEFEIWKIMKRESSARFFFFTEEQVEKYKQEEYINYLSNRYYELVNKYDEFGYLEKSGLKISVDSKYNIEIIYKGNWGGYLRDN